MPQTPTTYRCTATGCGGTLALPVGGTPMLGTTGRCRQCRWVYRLVAAAGGGLRPRLNKLATKRRAELDERQVSQRLAEASAPAVPMATDLSCPWDGCNRPWGPSVDGLARHVQRDHGFDGTVKVIDGAAVLVPTTDPLRYVANGSWDAIGGQYVPQNRRSA